MLGCIEDRCALRISSSLCWRCVRQKRKPTTARRTTAKATPTPMPAFAPIESPPSTAVADGVGPEGAVSVAAASGPVVGVPEAVVSTMDSAVLDEVEVSAMELASEGIAVVILERPTVVYATADSFFAKSKVVTL